MRTIRTRSCPRRSTAWPASRAERGTFISGLAGRAARPPASAPGSRRSSSSLVRTHVIGQRRALTSSAVDHLGYGSGRHAAPLLPDLARLSGLRARPLADLAGRHGCAPPTLRSTTPTCPTPTTPHLRCVAGRARARAGRDRRAARSSSATRSPACCGCTTSPPAAARRAGAAGRAAAARGRAGRCCAGFFPARRTSSAWQRAARVLRQRPVLPGGRGGRSTAAAADLLRRRGHINPGRAATAPWPRRGLESARAGDGRRSRRDSQHQLPDRARVAVREAGVRALEAARACARRPSLSSSRRERLRARGPRKYSSPLAGVEVDAAHRAQRVRMARRHPHRVPRAATAPRRRRSAGRWRRTAAARGPG